MGLCPNLSTRHFVQPRQYIKPCVFCCQSNKGCYSHPSDLVFILKIYLSISTWIWFFFFDRIYHTGHTFDLVSSILFPTLRFLDFLYSLKMLLAKRASLSPSPLSHSFSNAASSYSLAFNILPQICSLKSANSGDYCRQLFTSVCHYVLGVLSFQLLYQVDGFCHFIIVAQFVFVFQSLSHSQPHISGFCYGSNPFPIQFLFFAFIIYPPWCSITSHLKM